ncbi:MAG TPA: hypothetical protein VIJ38_03795 [Acidobacteriaceae bacterium]
MSTQICRHIHTNGARCGSPALRDNVFCYFHQDADRRHRSINPPEQIPATLHPIPKDHLDRMQHEPLLAEYYGLSKVHGPLVLDFPSLEDRESIQLALSMLITAMAQNRIDPKRASGLLYGLQVASANARGLNYQPRPSIIVRETVLSDDGLTIAPDEDPEAEITSQLLLAAILRDEAAEDEDDDEDDEDDDDEEDDFLL